MLSLAKISTFSICSTDQAAMEVADRMMDTNKISGIFIKWFLNNKRLTKSQKKVD
jgi:hypothetical protein